MDILRKFVTNQIVEVFHKGKKQKAKVIAVQNFYVTLEIGLDPKEYRLTKTEVIEMQKQAKNNGAKDPKESHEAREEEE